jgi:uncharacterized protein YbjT (DUF2867 family)
MGSTGDFEGSDRRAAIDFAREAKRAGVSRIIYLGGLGSGDDLSPHLKSRQEVGRILRASGVPGLEFRAGIILGSGSLSFEMIRSLVHELPVMLTPKWVRVETQPIGIEDVIDYLLEALDVEIPESVVFEIGGPDRASYGDLMEEFGRQVGLRRWIIPAPVLTPWLSSLWLGLVTPIYARIGRKLISSVRHRTVVEDQSALSVFAVRPRGYREAIARALVNEDEEMATTRWCDALSSKGETTSYGGERFGSRIVDSRARRVDVPPDQAFEPIQRIGGETGWYYGDWMWRLRGFLDLLVGGVGVRRGRRNPREIAVGDALDFWRVEAFEPARLLRLTAEMKVPGRAWLQFEVEPDGDGSIVRQTALFDPVGLGGLAYWYVLYPVHQFVFAGMLRNIASAARESR